MNTNSDDDDDDVPADILSALGGKPVLPSDLKMTLDELKEHLQIAHSVAPEIIRAYVARNRTFDPKRELLQLHLSLSFSSDRSRSNRIGHKHRGWTR
jgi:hypothetical protein